MKLEKIGYESAVVFGAFFLVMYLVIGVFQWAIRAVLLETYGLQVNAIQAFIVAPIAGGIIGYLSVVILIVIYNFVAMRYPISWTVKK